MRLFRNTLLVVFVIFVGISCQKSDFPTRVWQQPQTYLSEETLISKSGFPKETVGYALVEPGSGKCIACLNENKFFIPASTTKILTALAALDVLGPGYRFVTRVSYDGYIERGVLHGNIYLVGSGDPFLTIEELATIVEHMAAAGIRSVDGRFIVDDTFLASDTETNHNQMDDLSYNTGISALSAEFNQFRIVGTKDTDATRIYSVPALPLLDLSPSDEKNSHFIYQDKPESENWLYPDTFKTDEERLPIKHPSLFVGQLVATLCKMRDIELPLPSRGNTPPGTQLIFLQRSFPLVDLISMNLEFSNNMMSELIMLVTARKISGKSHTIKKSAEILTEWLKRKIPGTSQDGLILENGSGLSSANRISPEFFVKLLAYASTKKYAGRSFLSLLPVSGIKGTLKDRLSTPDAQLRVWAKTGTMNYGSALAGYLFTESGDMRIFAIMMGDLKARGVIDKDPNRPMNDDEMGKADRWISSARKLQDNLILSWIHNGG